jgi:V/A-type H+-transporting ATPase subunit D
MAKIKLTKGELKRRRDDLRQFERFLPTLQLKKQQLQIEILHQTFILQEKKHKQASQINSAESWLGLLTDPAINIHQWIILKEINTSKKNIAGVNLPVFEAVKFGPAEYDLFIAPLWVDAAIDILKNIISLCEKIVVIEQGIKILKEELSITTQRVNLFEKVKIPEAEEFIRIIKIYLGDQMTNAVGRSKIAKKKIEEAIFDTVCQ